MRPELKVIAGNSNIKLAQGIASYLNLDLVDADIKQFSDGEAQIQINENIRGADIFVVQSTCSPAATNLMELLIIIDALKRASARRITAVIPYFGFARQDRKVRPRVPITAKLVADLITTAGANRVVTVDLHAGQIQGFFNISVDNLFSTGVMVEYIRTLHLNDLVMVSPDAGGVERARAFAKLVNASLSIIDKRRSTPNEAEVMHIVGEVKDKDALIIDDMVDTAGTLTKAAKALKDNGAKRVLACCTHPVLSDDSIKRINDSVIEKLIVTDTIPLSSSACSSEKIETRSVASLLGEVIYRINVDKSVSSLFQYS
ncbi:MAG: ribose-phosphate pyrophosphokinase [bacterium]